MNSRRRQNQFTPMQFEKLENRCMLAGNVHVLVNDAILLVVGDGEANQVQMSQDGSGNYQVSGIDTTINGSDDPFTVSSSQVRHITVSMEGGNDEVAVNGLSVRSNFSFYGGIGGDRLTIRGLNAYHFHAEGNQGDDIFDVDMNIRKSTYFYLGAGNDVIASSSLNAGRNLRVFGHGGNDTVATEQLNVGRKLDLQLGEGNDQVALLGETRVSNKARIALGSGNDFSAILPGRNGGVASFRNSLNIDAGDGNDNVAFDPNVFSRRDLRANGGEGTDALQLSSSSFNRTRVGGFDSFQIPQLNNLLDQVFERLADVGIGDPITTPLSATASSSELTVNEQEFINVDPDFQLNGSDDVTSATVDFSNFIDGEDELTFSTAGTPITGSFNSTSGILALTGVASTTEYQNVIRSVQYRNSSDNPQPTTRQFLFNFNTATESVDVSRSFTVEDINDAPELNLNNSGVTITPDDLPAILDDQLTVSELDSEQVSGEVTLVTAQVAIVSGYVQDEDVLSVTLPNASFNSSFDSTTGILEITNLGTAEGTMDEWQTLLRTVTIDSQLAEPTAGTRTVRVTVDDGTDQTSADLIVTVDADSQPNNFKLAESTLAGTVIGRVTTDGTFDSPMVYQVDDSQISPVLQLNADDHFNGEATAPVVLVEYLSYQCPACAAQHPVVRQLEATFPEDLVVVSRHLPLDQFLPNAREAALAAEAAARQGAFDAMSDLLFENQSSWSGEADPTPMFEAFATQLNLDLPQFQADMQDPELNEGITADANAANSIGIMSTPTFALQGQQITTPGSQAAFDAVIQGAIDDLDSPFVVNRDTGDIVLRDPSLLNATTTPTIVIPVLVKDTSGNTESVDVTIRVTN